MEKITVGQIELLVEKADRYLQINDAGGSALEAAWRQIDTEYKPYDKWFCYHTTEPPADFLKKIGTALEDNDIAMRLTASSYRAKDSSGCIAVTEESFKDFAACHDQSHSEMYWNSEKIGRDLSRWAIFMLPEGGYILQAMWDARQAEIFCLEAASETACEPLLQAAAALAFDSGKKEILYMAESDSLGQQAALKAGFAVRGFYKGYLVKGTM